MMTEQVKEALRSLGVNTHKGDSKDFSRSDAESIHEVLSRDPSSISDEDHNTLCLSDKWFKDEGGSYEGLPCPVCEYRQRLASMRAQMARAGIAERYLDKRFADLEMVEPFGRIAKRCQKPQLAEIRRDGECLLLHGPPGQGKTQLAALIAKSAIVNGWTAYVANLGRLVVQIREGYEKKEEGAVTEEGVIRTLSDVDFLVLDDLGAGESDSQKIERRILYLVAEARQSGVKPTIITTNLGKGEVWDYLGARVANRFMPLSSIEVNHGTNFRSPVGRKTLW